MGTERGGQPKKPPERHGGCPTRWRPLQEENRPQLILPGPKVGPGWGLTALLSLPCVLLCQRKLTEKGVERSAMGVGRDTPLPSQRDTENIHGADSKMSLWQMGPWDAALGVFSPPALLLPKLQGSDLGTGWRKQVPRKTRLLMPAWRRGRLGVGQI